MDEREFLAQHFEEHRTRLRAVAYRMLGSLSEADDAVQETWLRLTRIDADEVENLGGWLTTVVARVSLNMLRSRRSRREEPIDVRMPEPIVDRADGTDPEHEALLADSVGLALLIVLESLNPAERLAFVLHDMFAVPFDEIAPIVDRSPDAARQLASRARRRVQGETAIPDADIDTQREVLNAFSRPRARATSRRCSRCWTRTWSSGLTAAPFPSARRGLSAERPTWPAKRSPSRASMSRCGRRSSTARSARSPSETGGRSRLRASRSETEGSSRWTSSPTPSASASSTW
jgi:RNA polymerase sigma factor (sigma-70 family)